MSSRSRRSRLAAVVLCLVLPLAGGSCAPRPLPHLTLRWVVGGTAPRFDPDGPPDATRWALERWLSFGLTDEDSAGRIVPAAAARWETSADGRTWTFHLRAGLAFTDGAPCSSADFARALAGGLGRTDHATRLWLLGALQGADRVRAGRPLPPLGIATPDSGTLVLRLARPDSTLAARLALPGVSAPWRDRTPRDGWARAAGLGPFRVAAEEAGRTLTLVRAVPRPGLDTLAVRFAIGAPRVRALLRQGRADLVWPLPPALLDEALPAGARRHQAPARPARTLVLVMRADTPPTHKLPARAALAHGLNRVMLMDALGPVVRPLQEWPVGCGRFEFPTFDVDEARDWMDRGKLGLSFHVTLGYDADGAGAAAARALQGEWARLGIYVGLEPLRGAPAEAAALLDGPHLFLTELQPLLDRPEAALAGMVMPLRGPAVGPVRTGWRTREFDPWIWPGARVPAAPLDAAGARQRIEEECIVLPLADLPWVWVSGATVPAGLALHPHYGPACISHDPPLSSLGH